MKRRMAEEIVDYDKKDGQLGIATIINADGSSPRDSGAQMLVYPDGRISGTIGGGPVEKDVLDRIVELLNDSPEKKNERLHFDISNEDAAQAGGICGGQVDIFIEIIDSGSDR